MFSEMLDRIKHEIISIVSRVQVRAQEDVEAVEEQRRQSANMQFEHADPGSLGVDEQEARAVAEGGGGVATFVRQERKVGRNEPCPCGSGKKYKHCHGRLNA